MYIVQTSHGANAGTTTADWWDAIYSSTLAQAREDIAEIFANKLADEDRGEEYEREWQELIEMAKVAHVGYIIAGDEFAARIIEEAD